MSDFKIETQTIKQLTSDNELSEKFDKYFSLKQLTTETTNLAIKVKFPTNDQILDDFWTKINKKKQFKGIFFRNSSQISPPSISKPTDLISKSVNEVTVIVRFTITSLDDDAASENCLETLTYVKSGNRYIFSK
jgi:hypothetical protein